MVLYVQGNMWQSNRRGAMNDTLLLYVFQVLFIRFFPTTSWVNVYYGHYFERSPPPPNSFVHYMSSSAVSHLLIKNKPHNVLVFASERANTADVRQFDASVGVQLA